MAQMVSKLRILGPVAIILLALGAGVAPVQAAPMFHIEEANTTITGTGGNFNFATSIGKVKCSSFALSGLQVSKTSTTMSLNPELSGCTFFGVSATVETHACFFEFHLVENSSPPTAKVDIVCPAGKEMTVVTEGSSCIMHIPPQTSLSHVVYETLPLEGSPTDVRALVTVSGIKYTLTAGCPGISQNVTLTNGEWTDTLTLRADNSQGKLAALWVE